MKHSLNPPVFLETALVFLFVGAAFAPAAQAGVDVDLSASVPIGQSGNLFVHICSRYFDYEPPVVEHWSVRYANPDDLAVALFVARSSGRTPDVIFALRRQGLSWWDVGLRTGVPMDAWFVPVDYTPGPPYGKAYGHWKKHHHNPKHVVVLTDREVRDLVAFRMAKEYYDVPPEEAMHWRVGGRNVRDVMVVEYERRHVHANPSAEPVGHAERGQGDHSRKHEHSKKHGDDHGQGHGDGHGRGHEKSPGS